MKRLVANGNVVNINAIGWKGYTLVQVAAFYGSADALEYLIELGADINVVKTASLHGWDTNGTALHIAAAGTRWAWSTEEGDLRVIAILLAAGANPMIRNAEGKTAAEVAEARGNARKAALLKGRDLTGSGPDRRC